MLRVKDGSHWVVAAAYRCRNNVQEFEIIDPGTSADSTWQTLGKIAPSKVRFVRRVLPLLPPRRVWLQEFGAVRVVLEARDVPQLSFDSESGLAVHNPVFRAGFDAASPSYNPWTLDGVRPLPDIEVDPVIAPSGVHVSDLPEGRYRIRGTATADGVCGLSASWTGPRPQNEKRHDFRVGTLRAGESFVLDITVGRCPADLNGDGVADFFDYLDFVAAMDAGEPGADFNGDQVVDFFDYLDFVQALDAGCD